VKTGFQAFEPGHERSAGTARGDRPADTVFQRQFSVFEQRAQAPREAAIIADDRDAARAVQQRKPCRQFDDMRLVLGIRRRG